jgi:CHAD domain-containing protein
MATTINKADSPTLHVKQLLLEALDHHWENYRVELKHCRDEFSNEAVHDLRSAARRMLALIQLLISISPRPRLEKLNHAFRTQLNEFDDLRDTQVVLAEISEAVQEFPKLRTFEEYLEEVEKSLLKTLRKKLKVIDLFDVSKCIRRMRESLKKEPDDNLVSQILQTVDDIYLVTRQRQKWINPAQASTIHHVRMAFKTFRYMVEIVHPLLPDFPLENLKRMNDYQSLMGEIQDVEVIMQMLADAPVSASAFDTEPVRSYYEHCHAEAIAAYMMCIKQLDTFWRHASAQPFPWEK